MADENIQCKIFLCGDPTLWNTGREWVVPDVNKKMATINSTNDKNMIKETQEKDRYYF